MQKGHRISGALFLMAKVRKYGSAERGPYRDKLSAGPPQGKIAASEKRGWAERG